MAEIGETMPVGVSLSDVMEHLAIAFSGIYEKLTERDQEVEALRLRVATLTDAQNALSNRIEALHRSLSDRIEHATDVAAGRDAR